MHTHTHTHRARARGILAVEYALKQPQTEKPAKRAITRHSGKIIASASDSACAFSFALFRLPFRLGVAISIDFHFHFWLFCCVASSCSCFRSVKFLFVFALLLVLPRVPTLQSNPQFSHLQHSRRLVHWAICCKCHLPQNKPRRRAASLMMLMHTQSHLTQYAD